MVPVLISEQTTVPPVFACSTALGSFKMFFEELLCSVPAVRPCYRNALEFGCPVWIMEVNTIRLQENRVIR